VGVADDLFLLHFAKPAGPVPPAFFLGGWGKKAVAVVADRFTLPVLCSGISTGC
jgi:hypothetical protein